MTNNEKIEQSALNLLRGMLGPDASFRNGQWEAIELADCRRVAQWLRINNHDVAEYTGKIDNPIREVLEQRLLKNEIKALVATVALGMGFDKPDLGFVIHFQRPSSVIAYYQQIGRAGRSLDTAYAILLTGSEDDEIGEYFINSAFPTSGEMVRIVHGGIGNRSEVY